NCVPPDESEGTVSAFVSLGEGSETCWAMAKPKDAIAVIYKKIRLNDGCLILVEDFITDAAKLAIKTNIKF
ncbi:MAG: hypothetical protein K2K58_07180, partial [Muribaculaceae bacterium]|nr:hypothetical protein [Muribaculaceae bacterium]